MGKKHENIVKNELLLVLERLGIGDQYNEVFERHNTKIVNDQLVSINLARLNLDEIPENLFESCTKLEAIVLSHNNLHTIPAGLFDQMENLKYLWLHNNELRELNQDWFSGLFNLEWLYLNNNNINNLNKNCFKTNSNLKDLRLNKNPVRSLPQEIFQSLNNLVILAIHSCKLSNFSVDLIKNAKYLERLYLQNNELVQLDPAILDLPNLRKIWISGNKFNYGFDTVESTEFEKLKSILTN